MSTLDNKVSLEPNRVPLGRRISEILAEKGGAFSIRAFADRIGMNRETLRIMVNGARRIAPSDLEIIAEGLGLSVERIKQTDTVRKEHQLHALLQGKTQTKMMLIQASEIADELLHLSIGATERGFGLNNVGRVQYLQQKYEEAHQTWLHAHELAKNIYEQYSDSHLLHLVTANLMLTYIIRKDFSNIEGMLEVADSVFAEQPRAIGLVHYTRMKMFEARGNLELAKKHAYLSLEHYQLAFDQEQTGIALVNCAHFEYVLKRYQEAAKLLPQAIGLLQHYKYYRIFAVNEYAKTLIKLRAHETANKMVEEHLESSKEYPDLYGKLLIAYSFSKDDPKYAHSVTNNTTFSLEVRFLACKYLMRYYSSIDDADSLMKYYKMGRMFSEIDSDFFD
ncbi:hypothetical protein CBW65_13285 [Tumebacillus avium]|uniref:HTH cro/C1-type domain-containing protein n=1 Tax=Tumebacillus avium TaxID=1903704 RepID=A0A1Y0IN27_9BACL|nr:helix-turn-helix transcriptional regulator [Tumebacillus avium]ARU61897.1 hypothetical protein CBW65_13285 [Tumebacillus avium]